MSDCTKGDSMTRQIWKFMIRFRDEQEAIDVSMPANAKILHFATQGPLEAPHIWALVDPSMPMVKRRFLLLPTGARFEWQGNAEYVGTIHVQDGTLVFHLFDCGEAVRDAGGR